MHYTWNVLLNLVYYRLCEIFVSLVGFEYQSFAGFVKWFEILPNFFSGLGRVFTVPEWSTPWESEILLVLTVFGG